MSRRENDAIVLFLLFFVLVASVTFLAMGNMVMAFPAVLSLYRLITWDVR